MRDEAATLAVAPADATYDALTALVDELARSGLRDACIAPGARSTPLTLALAAHPGLHTWVHIDERSAAFFALGLAKATRRPVAVVCTSGTAAANFFPAVVEALHARVPLLVLTADRPPELRACGAPQAIDQVKLYGDLVKWCVEVGDAAAGVRYFRTLACRAVATAAAAPAGPVHLNFPLREPLLPSPSWRAARRPDAERPYTAVRSAAPQPAPADVAALAARCAASPRGLIVCGPMDPDPPAAAALAALARRLGWPLLADATAQLRGGAHDTSAVIDTYDALLRAPDFAADQAPSMVLRCGALPISKALGTYLRAHDSARHVVVDPSGAWDDPLHLADEIMRADPALCAAALCATLGTGDPADATWLARWTRAAQRARRAMTAGIDAAAEPFEASVVVDLARALPDGATLYVNNSMATRDLESFWPLGERRVRVLCNRGANGIDGFVSSALGAAAGGAQPLVALSGDLGFYHDLNGLLAAKQHRLRAVFVVLNNDGGGIFSYLPQAECGAAFDTLFVTPHGLDFRGAVEMYGCAFVRAGTRAAFAAALERALPAGGTTVIEVPIDRARSVALHRELWTAGTRAAAAGDGA